jgi:serine/threonine protein kinase
LQENGYAGPQADVWALGCCLYILLTGVVPFPNANQAINSNYIYPPKPISDYCFDLLNRMLEKCPNKRATLKEILQHPWITIKEL